LERREKIGRHWFGKVNPLHVHSSAHDADGIHLELEDLAVRYGLSEASSSSYSMAVLYGGDEITTIQSREVPILISAESVNLMRDRLARDGGSADDRVFVVLIHTVRNDKAIPFALELSYWHDTESDTFKLISIIHHD